MTSAPSPADTRQRILATALDLFCEKGFDATSMREVAEGLGVTKAALYYHFDGKVAILDALMGDVADEVVAFVDWALRQSRGPRLRRAAVERWSDLMVEHGVPVLQMVTSTGPALRSLDADRRCLVKSRFEELFAWLEPEPATLDDRLRVRLSLHTLSIAGLAELGATRADAIAAGRRLALELMPAID